jgi:hypothetical protein
MLASVYFFKVSNLIKFLKTEISKKEFFDGP